ncbi:MORN motif precursor [Kordia algicida OT-1]|uniref:MORN motif n=1 Tax=Kordia algicida OT-1 TaxID=391587 RepID=A9DPW2_9FLAO|nr:MORN motif precursor [Kordia algicida]EDP97537.1 MORN motif precursor [Kordia algicida OT-1]
MKNLVLPLLFCFICQWTLAQKIDMDNAPRNPIGFKHKKEHFFLRGDIYASSGKIFDKKGNLVYNYGTRYYYNSNGRITGNNYDDKFEYDSRGNITKFQYKSGSTSNYTFNNKDLLVYEKTSYGDEKTYTYDSNDRVIKAVIKKKGKKDQERFFSYVKKGDSLVVDMSYIYANGRKGFKGKSYYLNGFLVKEEVSSGTYRYIVEVDDKRNKIDFYDADRADAKHFETFNRYYSDINKPQKIEYGYHKLTSSSKKGGAVYINGKRATDIAISKGVKPNEKVVYDGLTQTYYAVKNIIPENHTIDTRIPVTNVLMKGQPYMNYVHDGKFINYVHGYNRVKSRDFSFLGPHMIDYRVDKSLGRTYIIYNYKNIKDQKLKRMELLSPDATSIFYIRELDKENFFIVDKGKHIDYKNARFEYLDNGDPVIFVNEKPTYVLLGFRMAKNNEVLKGKHYSGELDNNQTTSTNTDTTTTTTNDSSGYNCVKGDCKEGWGRVKIGEIVTDATFKNGAIEGVAYITYPEDSYFHGQYKNNRRHGIGYYQWSSGNSYVGGWKDGKQHGLGYTMNKENKIITAGLYENGKLIQEAGVNYKSGKKTGNCTGDCVDGFGKYNYSNGDVYLGFFKGGKRFGVGTYLWKNKSVYTGAYTADGKRNGYGMYTYVDRSVFKGMFVNDRIDGLGVMKYNSSGNVVQGVFNNKGSKVKDY